jgi:hypothetical protein
VYTSACTAGARISGVTEIKESRRASNYQICVAAGLAGCGMRRVESTSARGDELALPEPRRDGRAPPEPSCDGLVLKIYICASGNERLGCDGKHDRHAR